MAVAKFCNVFISAEVAAEVVSAIMADGHLAYWAIDVDGLVKRLTEIPHSSTKTDTSVVSTAKALMLMYRTGIPRENPPILALKANEVHLLSFVRVKGLKGAPVRQARCRQWVWADSCGVKGSPIVYKTKRDAMAAFTAFIAWLEFRDAQSKRAAQSEDQAAQLAG